MPLRIVVDVRHIHDFGYGTYIRNLLSALSRIDAENQYLLTGRSEDAQALPGLPENFQWLPYTRRDRDAIDHLAYPYFLHSLRADLFHIPLNMVPYFMPRPYVVTIHDMSSLLFPERRGIRSSLHLYRFRRGLLRARRIIAVSQATSRDVENLLRIPPLRIHQIYSAPDPRFLSCPSAAEERQRVLERYQIHEPFLLYAGTIRPQKNVTRLIEAFAVLRANLEQDSRFRELRLVIIGDEISRHPEVRRTVIRSRMQRYVRFLGFVPFETLRVFYERAAVFVFPSLYEGFGLPPLEAMACGTPVVTAEVSSLPEVVGDAAVMVNPENVFEIAHGIEQVLKDPDYRQQLVARGYRQLAQFSWDRTARAVREVYEQSARGT